MDRDPKLERYTRKDYSELVEFPVEIVGRDGVVRRYSFEDSIRLYQRRITFAPIRYRDGQLVTAEVGHCRSRIDQLRRSYFHRFGWGTPEGERTPEESFGDLAGEVAAFVCRVLKCEGRPDVRLERVSDEGDGRQVWYLQPRNSENGMLLYVYRFEGEGADRLRDGFFGQLKSVERAGRVEGDGESLLAFHHTVDCGFVLTGRGREFAGVADLQPDDDELASVEPTAWDRVMDTIRRGDHSAALGACQQLVEQQPYHRSAYVAGAMLAVVMGQLPAAEDLAVLGSRYFPNDGLLSYHLGLARLRQGHVDEGLVALREAVRLEPGMVAARFLLVTSLLERHRYREAARVLRERWKHPVDDRRGGALLTRLEQWVRWRRLMVGAGLLAGILGVAAAVMGGWVGLIPVALGLGMALVGAIAFRQQLDRIVALQRFDDVAYGIRRLHRRERDAADLIS